MLGMVLYWIDRLNMSVRAPMATGPSCFRCLYEMPSGPTEEVGFVYSIACLVILGVKDSRSLKAVLRMENTFTSEVEPKQVYGENSVRRKFRTAKIPYGENSLRRKFRTAKNPYGENSYGEKSVRRKIRTAKTPYGEKSYGENSYGEKSNGEKS